MARYESKEIAFDYPDGWSDRSVIAVSPPPNGKKTMMSNFVMTKEKLQKDETLKTFSARQMTQMAKSLKDFELRDSRDLLVGGAPAVQIWFTWASPNALLSQRVTMVQSGAQILLFTGTSSVGDAVSSAKAFDRILASVQITSSAPTSIAPVADAQPGSPEGGDARPPQGWGPGTSRRR